MKKLLAFFLAISLFLAFSVIPAEAKDLAKRVGLGYNAQIAFEGFPFPGQDIKLAGPSVKYVISPEIAVQGIFGLSMYSNAVDVNIFFFGGKFLYNIIQEDNMNFYAGGGFGIVSAGNGDSETGIVIIGCVGEEFFFSGLPNLGFAAEMGLMIASMADATLVSTYGGFLNLGIHYYF